MVQETEENWKDEAASTARAATPEVVGHDVVESMRKQALELKETLAKGKGKETALEHELVDMVLKIASFAIPLQAQLLDQAESLAVLMRQRQFLLDRAQEERELWKAEKDSWDRTSEALLAQVTRATPSFYREHEVNRHTANLDADNLALRMKLTDAQSRLSALEAELAQLRPILLMQPYALVHSHLPADAHKPRKKKNENLVMIQSDPITDITEDTAPVDEDPQLSTDRKPKGQYYRQREQLPLFVFSPRKAGSSSTVRSRPTMADARAEHLLLAARKIGKERASILAAMNHFHPIETKATTSAPVNAKGKGRAEDGVMNYKFSEYVPMPTTPKTPQKPAKPPPPVLSPAHHSQHPSLVTLSPGFTSMVQPYAYVPGAVPGPAYALYSPSAYTYAHAPPPNHLTASPSRQHTHAASPSNGHPSSSSLNTPNNNQPLLPARQPPPSPSKTSPSTPFDKLLSAARSVLSPATGLGSPSKKQGTARGRAPSRRYPSPTGDGSPTPKRRKVANSVPANEYESSQAGNGLGRTASALDVLADQAAVFAHSSGKRVAPTAFQASAPERNDEDFVRGSSQGVDMGGSNNVFSASDLFVNQTKPQETRKRGARIPRETLGAAVKLPRAPRKGKPKVKQATGSRAQSPANTTVNEVPEDDDPTEALQRRSRSPYMTATGTTGRAQSEGKRGDDATSTRASTPSGQDDMRQRWLSKLGR